MQKHIIDRTNAKIILLSCIIILIIQPATAIYGRYSESSPFSCGLNCGGSNELFGNTREDCVATPGLCFNIIDGCDDGSAASYEFVKDITITDLNSSTFTVGDTINIDVLFDCDVDGNIVSIAYHNGSGFRNIYNAECIGSAEFHHYHNLTLDNIEGNHTIRAIIGFPGAVGTTCGADTPGPKWTDTDDVTFMVNETADTTIPNVTNPMPSFGTVYEKQEGLEVQVCIDANDPAGISTVVANISWAQGNEIGEIGNTGGDTYCAAFTSTTEEGNYTVNFTATDNAGNINGSVSTIFIIRLTTNITIQDPLPEKIFKNNEDVPLNFTIDKSYDASSIYSLYYLFDEDDPANIVSGQESHGLLTSDAQGIIGENTTSYSNLSMSFKVPLNTTINSASIRLIKNGTGAVDSVIEVRTDDDGRPSDTVLGTGTIDPDTVSDLEYTLINLAFSTTIELEANESYWLSLNPQGSSDETNFYSWESSDDGLYADGNYSNNNTKDLLFQISDLHRYRTSLPRPARGSHLITIYAESYTLPNIRSPTVSFEVDSNAPEIRNITYSPSTTNALDPEVQINFTANITDSMIVDGAVLEYRKENESEFQNKSTTNSGAIYSANFTPDTESVYIFRLVAWDDSENYIYSDEITLNITYERNWTRSPDSFDIISGTLNNNKTAGNISITNGGDFAIAFNISRNDSTGTRVFINGSENSFAFTLQSGATIQLPINATTRSEESEDDIIILIDALNESSEPDYEYTNFTLISYLSGAYLNVQIFEYDSTVTQGDERITLSGRITNAGNETANNIITNWSLPTGWTPKTNITAEFTTLAPGAHVTFTRYINIEATAEVGNKTLQLNANCSEGKSDSDTRNVTVNRLHEDENQNPPSGGGGGGGGSSGGMIPLKKVPKIEFSINPVIEIKRGTQESISGAIKNIGEAKLTGITLELEGFPANRYNIMPASIQTLDINKTIKFNLTINAPEYYGSEKQNVKIIIRGSYDKEEYSLSKDLSFIIFKEDKEDSLSCFDEAEKKIAEAKNSGLATAIAETNLQNSRAYYDGKEYEHALSLCNEIIFGLEQAFELKKSVEQLNTRYSKSGTDNTAIKEMIELSEQALTREDYALAQKRSEQAQMMIESKEKEIQQALPYRVGIVQKYLKEIIGILILTIIIGIFIHSSMSLNSIKNKIKELGVKKEEILGRIQAVQERYFVNKDIPMRLYHKEMAFHRESLIELEKKHSELMLRKLKITSGKTSQDLEKVKKEAENNKEEVQKKYYVEKTIDQETFKKLNIGFENIIQDIEHKIRLHQKK